jgi:hypothetical protein
MLDATSYGTAGEAHGKVGVASFNGRTQTPPREERVIWV